MFYVVFKQTFTIMIRIIFKDKVQKNGFWDVFSFYIYSTTLLSFFNYYFDLIWQIRERSTTFFFLQKNLLVKNCFIRRETVVKIWGSIRLIRTLRFSDRGIDNLNNSFIVIQIQQIFVFLSYSCILYSSIRLPFRTEVDGWTLNRTHYLPDFVWTPCKV